MPKGRLAVSYLICPIGVARDASRPNWPLKPAEINAGQELAPAFTIAVNRLLWRHRAFPSATLDKMRTEL
jgi:hypothetical protein